MRMFKFSKKIFSPEKKEVIFFFHGWINRRWQFFWLLHKLSKDYCVVAYDYTKSILRHDSKASVKNIKEIVKDAEDTLKELDKKSYYAIGFSLGAIMANLLAYRTGKISKLVLIAIGANFSDCIRKGTMKKKLHKITNLDAYSEIDPEKHICKAKIYLVLSENDVWLPYEEGQRFVELAKPAKIKIHKWMPHPWLIIYYGLAYRFCRNAIKAL